MLDELDWVSVLRERAEAIGQRAAGAEIGYSAAVVSQTLKGAYKGNLDAVETAVRGAWMGGLVPCPELGDLEGHHCIAWQKKAAAFRSTNQLRVRMFGACHA
ncbi:MAG: hypothetical protein AAF401_10405, partial [Pseudomonadota bacterium]